MCSLKDIQKEINDLEYKVNKIKQAMKYERNENKREALSHDLYREERQLETLYSDMDLESDREEE